MSTNQSHQEAKYIAQKLQNKENTSYESWYKTDNAI